ncbi:S-layer homology domain-containing protein [Phosphitispora fastidiosa]|uniref:S-layer homology domain-containing protein n=1 Tax=Phosphitispora fastidiosa TaxID=2837202 RepID=UPI001E6064BD|nr:S-layer homology domain-containing protein [Phosphitispora fastidiosa]MBU7005338.1 putative membrane protein YkoI [Phosphitispora fastidiosa]
MKRALALLLVIVFVTTFLFPAYSFAQYDRDLEKAIETAKTVFEISDEYDNFSYNMHKQGERTIFELMWNDESNRLGSKNVSIDTLGKITGYYSYSPAPVDYRPKLPAINKEDARTKAEDFIKKINAIPFENLQYQQEDQRLNVNESSYYFRYNRIEKGVPYYMNNVHVSVNNVTGKVESYNCSWNYELDFPDVTGIITLEEAQKIYVQELGLKLQYKIKWEPDKYNPYLVYTNVYYNHSIDAATGEVFVADPYYGIYNEGGAGERKMADSGMHSYGGGNEGVSLTPKEREAIENAAGIMNEDKAEETARKALNIGNDLKVTNINLYKNWINNQDYLWNIYFTKEQSAKDSVTRDSYFVPGENYSVSIDAKTGELVNFYKSEYSEVSKQPRYNEAQSLKIATDYIKALQPQRYIETEYVTWNQPVRPLTIEGEKPRQYYFTFERKTNGAYFPDNGFNVAVDTVTGSVISYSFNWYKGELPKTDGILTLADANTSLLEKVGLQLQYTPYRKEDAAAKIMPPPYEGLEDNVKLVYALKTGVPANIDPYSGVILDYNAEPYSLNNVNQYTDISGHYAENKIMELATFGISLPGEKFEPDNKITQREFLYLLEKTINSYYPNKTDKEKDNELYANLISRGVVREGEQAPDSFMTRQDAVKFIIRSLNYSRVAEIDKGIFTLPFKDAAKIDRKLFGYVAVAYGLNIVQGNNGYFNPTGQLTRGQAAVTIHNFLNAR